jgi:hypothetical protein
MRWWSHLWRSSSEGLGESIRQVCLALPGWNEDTPHEGGRNWRDIDGNVLALDFWPEPFRHAESADEIKVRKWCRGVAESRSAGLIEACAIDGGIRFIYKRLQIDAYVYTGMLITRVRKVWLIWTMVAGEKGTTGVREVVVTANLMNEGRLTIDGYKKYWAQDPYEPAYRGVDRSVLRFMSDDERYDEQFPEHPLSKVRRLQATLPSHVEYYSPVVSPGSSRLSSR